MLLNWETRINGECVSLLPYCRSHVATYHNWMKDPWLLEMTASEPLSLDEEYAMQASWRDDPKKLTFIVADRSSGKLAGDVNLFYNISEDENAAEIEVMIAEQEFRRKGFAREALCLLMVYAQRELGTARFVAKIGEKNVPSLSLFRKLGYVEDTYCDVFKEYTLNLNTEVLAEEWVKIEEIGARGARAPFEHTSNDTAAAYASSAK